MHECKECMFSTEKKSVYNKHMKSEEHKKVLELLKEEETYTITKKDKEKEGYIYEEVIEKVIDECKRDCLFMLPINVKGSDNILEAMLLNYYEIENNQNQSYNSKYKTIVKHNLCRTIELLYRYESLDEECLINKYMLQLMWKELKETKTENGSLKKELEELKASHNQMSQNLLCKVCSQDLSSDDSNKSP
jgi:hypothetical protein